MTKASDEDDRLFFFFFLFIFKKEGSKPEAWVMVDDLVLDKQRAGVIV